MKKILYIGMPFDQGKSGISRYIEQTLSHLSMENDVSLIMMRRDHDIVHESVSGVYDWLIIGRSSLWAKPILNILFHCFVLPIFCVFKDYDYVFFPAGNRRFPLFFSKKTITMVHDFSHLHIPGKYDFFREFYVTKILPVFLRGANLIFTPSQSTKNDLLNLCGLDEQKVRVNPLGFNYPKVKLMPNESRKKHILYVSRVEHPGKNHLGLIQAFEIFCNKSNSYELRMVGGDWNGSEEVHSYHSRSEAREKMKFLGHLSEEDLEREYTQASIFIYPSFYEGFGLPLLEAMSRGIPVISSNKGSLPEVGASSVLYIDPEKPSDIAEKLHKLTSSTELQQKYIQLGIENLKRFSWKEHVERFPN